jgi:hypothetical protein
MQTRAGPDPKSIMPASTVSIVDVRPREELT